MKKIITIITLSLALLFSAAACGSDNTGADNQAGAPAQENNQPAGAPGGGQGGPGGQQGFEAADLSGEVVSVDGNKVELKLIEMPSFNRGNREGSTSGGAIEGRWGNDGGTSGSAIGERRGNGRNTTGGAIDGQRPQMTVNYTGETKTVTIPDGVEITTTVRGDNGMEQKALTTADLKQGEILQVWYSDKASETISRISVRSVTP